MSAATELPSQTQRSAFQENSAHARRDDLDGLRAVAALLVVLFHASIPGLPGGFVGVDVFYVLSGFFITGILLRDIERFGRIRFAEFYSRRARRLIPAAALVLFVTAFAVWYFMPLARLRDAGLEILTASTYQANFRFAGQATNYFATEDPSPVLHYWSLAVEEQFYFFWPIYLLACAILAKKIGRKIVNLGIVFIIFSSLIACIWFTYNNQPIAFYMFPMRAWELGIGALAYILGFKSVFRSNRFAPIVGWLGLIAVMLSGLTFNEQMAFPGYASILPAMGCFLLAVAAPHDKGPSMLLSRRPLVKLGQWSYSLYLWHWPVLVLAGIWLGRKLTLGEASALVVVSIILAWATYTFWENPIRNAKVLRISNISTSIVALVLLFSSIGPAVSIFQRGDELLKTLQIYTFKPVKTPKLLEKKIAEGVRLSRTPEKLSPSLASVEHDYPNDHGCFLDFKTSVLPKNCTFGDPKGDFTVMLTGDSHGNQWLTPISKIALQNHWKLTFFAKAACPISFAPAYNPKSTSGKYPECEEFKKQIIKRIAKDKPDLLILGAARAIVSNDLIDYQNAIKAIQGQKRMILLDDNPYTPRENLLRSNCIARNMSNVSTCNLKASKALDHKYSNVLNFIAQDENAEVLRVDQWFCDKKICPVIINDIQVYRLGSHITNAYAEFLTPFFKSELEKILQRFERPIK